MTPLFLALSCSNCLILGPLVQSFGASVSSSVNQRKKGTTPPCFINEMGFCRSATEQFRGLYKTTAVLLLCGCPLVTSCGALVSPDSGVTCASLVPPTALPLCVQSQWTSFCSSHPTNRRVFALLSVWNLLPHPSSRILFTAAFHSGQRAERESCPQLAPCATVLFHWPQVSIIVT